jgi:hypothetical protein
LLGSSVDPVNMTDTDEPVIFSPENKFAQGLSAAIGVGPGAILLWPLTQPANQVLLLGTSEIARAGRLTMFPDDLPPSWVVCAGQTYEYADGTKFTVPSMVAGTPEYYNSVYYKAAYVMKIPAGPVNSPIRRNFLANLVPAPEVFSLTFI